MLQAINDKAKGIIGWIIIALISFTFALFGIADYLGDGTAPFAAKVDDTEISVRTYQEALSRQRQRLESMFGGNLPTDAAFEKRMKQQVMEQLIIRALIENRANEAGYRVTNKMASDKIKTIEAFQQEGKFISAIYKQTVNSQGMSLTQFEDIFKKDMIVQQMQGALVQSSIVGNESLLQLNSLQQQTRDVSYIEFNNAKYASSITLKDEDVQQYYDQNSDRYMHPEQVSISYIEIKTSDISSAIEIDEEALRRQYDEYVASIANEEQRRAKHILIQLDSVADEAAKTKAKNKVDEVLSKLKSGTSFDELAKKISDDPGSATKGGDLGWINRGLMGDAFDDALFKLNKNEVSKAVRTSFGYHIIKLTDIKGSKPDSYEAKKAELIKQLKQEDIEKIFYDRSELMATLAYENDDTLLPVAEALQLKIKQTDLFTQESGSDIALNKIVRDAVFNSSVLKEGRNSEVIELDSSHILVLRLDQHINAKPKTLDEVRPVIETTLKSIKAKEKAQADALQVLADLQQGKAIQQVAKTQKLSLKKLGKIKRDNASANQTIVGEAFRMNKPLVGKSEFKAVDLEDGVAVIELGSVTDSESQANAQQLQTLAKNIESGLSNQEMTAVIELIKSKSDIIESKNL